MELTALMLDRYDFLQDEDFVRNTLVPLADPITAFFDQYWQKRDAKGRIVFDPAQSLEALPWTVNPMPEIAGLRFILPRLLALPQGLTTEAQRSRWTRILQELPPLPVAEVDAVNLLRPSATFVPGSGNFSENPELYAVFPYRLYGVGRPDLDMARPTYERRVNRHNFGWCQDSIQAACLGLDDEAARLVAARAALDDIALIDDSVRCGADALDFGWPRHAGARRLLDRGVPAGVVRMPVRIPDVGEVPALRAGLPKDFLGVGRVHGRRRAGYGIVDKKPVIVFQAGELMDLKHILA